MCLHRVAALASGFAARQLGKVGCGLMKRFQFPSAESRKGRPFRVCGIRPAVIQPCAGNAWRNQRLAEPLSIYPGKDTCLVISVSCPMSACGRKTSEIR